MDGRKLKSINQWYNKENARLQRIEEKRYFGKKRANSQKAEEVSFPFQHVAFPPFFATLPIYEVHHKLASLRHAQNPKASVAKNVSTPLSLVRERTCLRRIYLLALSASAPTVSKSIVLVIQYISLNFVKICRNSKKNIKFIKSFSIVFTL